MLFAEQVVIKHLARDRCRRGAAMAAVFDQHRQCDPGFVGRSVGDVPSMIAMPLTDIFGDIFLTLFHGNHLRRAGLGGNLVGRTHVCIYRRAAGLCNSYHCAPDQIQGLRVDVQIVQGSLADGTIFAAVWTLHFFYQMWLVCHAVVRQRGSGKSQLHGGDQAIALPDADRYGVTRIPYLVVAFHFPFPRRQQPRSLPLQVNPRFLAKTKARQIVVYVVYAHIVCKAIEIGVARHLYGLEHVHATVAACLPIAILAAAARQIIYTGIVDGLFRGSGVIIQSGQGHERFDGRT